MTEAGDMTITHLVLRYAHISMGLLAIASGAVSMSLRKGSRPHHLAGNVFFVSMLIMSGVGTFLSVFMVPNKANIMGGSMAFYLTASAWITVWRKPGRTGRLEIATMLLALARVWRIRWELARPAAKDRGHAGNRRLKARWEFRRTRENDP